MPNTVPEYTTAAQVIHVAVAVIVNNGMVLIARRAEHVHQGGLWEFPGGKVEADESVAKALVREIREELGIIIKSSRPLIRIKHQYADKCVLLDTWLVSEYTGKAYARMQEHSGLEGQQVKWVDIAVLNSHQFPAANQAIINAVQLPEHFAITPDYFDCENLTRFGQGSMAAAIDAFLHDFKQSAKQCHLLQLRIKSLEGELLDQVTRQACILAKAQNARLLLNSAMSVSETISQLASGIHLTAAHLHDRHFVACYRSQYPDQLIAASCHDLKDIHRANDLQLDFIVLSPVQQTASHPGQRPLGWEQFQLLCDDATVPVFALGGMTRADTKTAQLHGGQGIAAIRSLWAGETIEEPRLEK